MTGPRPSIGVIFQDASTLLPWKTVLENVMFPIQMLHQLPQATYLDRARELLNLTVGLAGFENHKPHQLSGGMRQRVGDLPGAGL